MAAILLLLVVLAYANAADEHGSQKQAEFWGNHSTERDRAQRADHVITPQNIERFGYRFGGKP